MVPRAVGGPPGRLAEPRGQGADEDRDGGGDEGDHRDADEDEEQLPAHLRHDRRQPPGPHPVHDPHDEPADQDARAEREVEVEQRRGAHLFERRGLLEEALRASEERFRKIIETAGEGIAIRDYSKTQPGVTFLNGSSGALETTYVTPSENFFRWNMENVNKYSTKKMSFTWTWRIYRR